MKGKHMGKQVWTTIVFSALALLGSTVWAHGGQEHLVGVVKAVDASTMTVETKEKTVTKVLIDNSTKFEKSGSEATLKDLTVGERVVIHAVKKGADLVAMVVKFGAPRK